MIHKEQTYFSITLRGVLVFRDNIEEIIDRLKKYSLTIEIHDENYSYENIDDLIKQKGNHPKTLEIKAENKNKGYYESVNLDFDGKAVTIRSHGSKNMYALGFELKDYLKSKRPWYFRFFNPWLFFGAFIGWGLFFNPKFSENKSTANTLRIWISGILILLFLISLYINFMTLTAGPLRRPYLSGSSSSPFRPTLRLVSEMLV